MNNEVVSSFFAEETIKSQNSELSTSMSDYSFVPDSEIISDKFLHIVDELNISLEQFKYPTAVECVYNPTIYARHTFEMYVRKYCNTTIDVPFGEISSVRDWLGIEGPVNKPPEEITARPVKGFDCTRSEISGKRFWGLFKNVCGTPEKFFKSSFVYNYIPQQWMKKNGCNLTPGDFKMSQMENLFNICDPFFIKVLELYEVKTIVAVGKFCETRAQKAVKKFLSGSEIQIFYLPHPSPRTVNNNNWEKKAVEHLNKLNLLRYYQDKKLHEHNCIN